MDFNLSIVELYVLFINILSFLLYGFDKLQAIRTSKEISRVPEVRLLSIALIGGSIGAILAMIIFRHKIKKFNFIWKYIVIVIAQLVIGYYFIYNQL